MYLKIIFQRIDEYHIKMILKDYQEYNLFLEDIIDSKY